MANEPKRPLRPAPAPSAGRIEALAELVEVLRGPDGCPWDRAQKALDLRAYLLEEAHEVAAALDEGEWPALRAELGDLLFQVVFLASLAREAGAFSLADVVDGVHHKMVERHPHVFSAGSDGAQRSDGSRSADLKDAEDVRQAWERRKVEQRAQDGTEGSLLAGVSRSLPALVASYRLTQKAAGVGFDWPDTSGVFAKLTEETAELRRAIDAGSADAAREEVGDLLFTVANLARKLNVDPEAALAGTNLKFRRRFEAVERALSRDGERLGDVGLDRLDELWNRAKEAERAAAD
jgi:ATP diphosphatase